jgi:hypothetical protein
MAAQRFGLRRAGADSCSSAVLMARPQHLELGVTSRLRCRVTVTSFSTNKPFFTINVDVDNHGMKV